MSWREEIYSLETMSQATEHKISSEVTIVECESDQTDSMAGDTRSRSSNVLAHATFPRVQTILPPYDKDFQQPQRASLDHEYRSHALTSARKYFDPKRSTSSKIFHPHPRLRDDDLDKVLTYFYTKRSDLDVHVVDFSFGSTRESRLEIVKLRTIEQQFVKPENVDVRWIHVPLTTGNVLSSTIEELFRRQNNQGESKSITGNVSEFSAIIDVLSIRSESQLLELHVYNQLVADLEQSNPELIRKINNLSTTEFQESIQAPVHAKLKQNELEEHFWGWHCSDNPIRIINERKTTQGHYILKSALLYGKQSSVFSMHRPVKNSSLVKNSFRLLVREDGVILTMASPMGIHYFNSNFEQNIQALPEHLIHNYDASALGLLFNTAKVTALDDWRPQTANDLMIHIMTELCVCPYNNDRQGKGSRSLLNIYTVVLEVLAMRRRDSNNYADDVRLGVEFKQCIDELTGLIRVFQENINTLKKLSSMTTANSTTKIEAYNFGSLQRIDDAIEFLTESSATAQRLLQDARESIAQNLISSSQRYF